ncbi:MAG: hypothetical protein B7Z73_15030 [Planctomycetia bacterium 21-64-5]|nr:MAG: hypothetical protein B7Z73_15030 [Planctomycetia bacterium 21-64-5]
MIRADQNLVRVRRAGGRMLAFMSVLACGAAAQAVRRETEESLGGWRGRLDDAVGIHRELSVGLRRLKLGAGLSFQTDAMLPAAAERLRQRPLDGLGLQLGDVQPGVAKRFLAALGAHQRDACRPLRVVVGLLDQPARDAGIVDGIDQPGFVLARVEQRRRGLRRA